MTIWMDVNTSLASVPVNAMPLIDDTDFKTIEDAVVYDQAGLALFWNFTNTSGTTTVTAVTPTTGGVHDWTDFTTSGMYGIEIPAGSPGTIRNDTEGFGHFTGVATGILPWSGPIIGFRASAINDALVDSDTLIDNADNQLLYESTIDTVTGQQEFIMDVAFPTEDAWIGCSCSLEDVSTGSFYSGGVWISDTTEATETLHINVVFPVTVVAGDKIRIYAGQHPTYALNNYNAATTTATSNILDKLLAYFQLALREDAAIATDNAAELTEINADGGSGGGSYVNTSDSQSNLQAQIAVLPANTWAELLGTTTLSASAILQIIASASAGKLSGAATTTITIRNIEDDEDTIVATVDTDGNRSAVTVTTPSD